MFKTFQRAGCLLAAGALVMLAAGCGKKGPVLYPVKGVVRINGEPAKDVNVMFTPVGPLEGVTEPLSPAGVTGEDGSFRLMSFKPGDGAPAGEYRVTVSSGLMYAGVPSTWPSTVSGTSGGGTGGWCGYDCSRFGIHFPDS